jgi:hypothetical protein
MAQVIEFRSKVDTVSDESDEDEPEAILEGWAPGTDLVTAEGRQLLLDALELLHDQLFDEFRRSGCSDHSVFQRLIWRDDLVYTLGLAERIEIACRLDPEQGDRSTLPARAAAAGVELVTDRRLQAV